MKKSGKFLTSAASNIGWINDNVIEVVFIGRSNVGKSSLINALAKKKIAHTSKTPGRTQLANFFDFKTFRIVDMPGYGYAKVGQSKKESLTRIIDEVISKRENIYIAFQICDVNVITSDDIEMQKQLKEKFVHTYVILNKCDKRPLKYYFSNLDKISRYLGVKKDNLILVSAKDNINLTKLVALITNIIKPVK